MSAKEPRGLDECINILDLGTLARRCLPSPIFPYLVGAAESERTAERNTAAFDDIALIPRCLVDVSSVKTATSVLGQQMEWPVFCSPTGASRLFHPDGELAVARAAAASGIIYGLSTNATHSLEAVASASDGPKLFQLFIFKDRDLTRRLIERCKKAGYTALCLTVDTTVRGNCEREQRAGLSRRFSLAGMASFVRHPAWSLGQLQKGPLSMAVMAECSGTHDFAINSSLFGELLDPSVTWADVREMIELWRGPFAIKGVMCADDARRAIDVGATAVIVSNHGGRQLDGAAAAVEVLPAVVRAVGDQAEVILDGGIRRGVHVLKALALGAKACSVGRATLFGLAAGGEAGVRKALDILRTELVRAMQLAGCADVGSIDARLVQRNA